MAFNLFNRRKTSYVAQGHVEPPKQGSEIGSAISGPIRELVPELVGRTQQLLVWEKMARTDVTSSVSLRTAKVPILAADFYIDPEGDDEQATTVAQFVDYNLFSGMSSPWTWVLWRILKGFQHGKSVFEEVWEDRAWAPNLPGANAKTYTMLRKLAYRPTLTISDIEVDDQGGPETIVQQAINAKGQTNEVRIPIDKAVIFTFGDSDSIHGESILRSAYPHWFYKTHLYKVDAIQKERHGIGIPKGKLMPGYTQADKDALNELLSNLRTNEKAHMTLPPGLDVEFAKLEGQLVDVLRSASVHDVMIMLNVMAEFMMLGISEGTGGARATSASQTDVFYKSEIFIANTICDYFNMFVIPKLVLYNFQVDKIPQMKVRSIGQTRDLQQLWAALANAANAEYITVDLDTEQWARDTFDMPRKKGERPQISQTQMRENILLQGQFKDTASTPATPSGTGNGKSATTDVNASADGQGNMGKGPTQA